MVSNSQQNPSARLEAFSDATFAFSATLLVVSLEVPDTFPELVSELKGFIAFGIRFGVLITLWTVHNAFFRRYPVADKTITFLNSALLFVILFYVYPLKFLTESFVAPLVGDSINRGMQSYEDLALLFLLYSLGFVAVFGAISLMYYHVFRKTEPFNLNAYQQYEAIFYARHYGIFAGVGLLSILMAVLKIGVAVGAPGFIYALLGPLCYWHGTQTSKQAARLKKEFATTK